MSTLWLIWLWGVALIPAASAGWPTSQYTMLDATLLGETASMHAAFGVPLPQSRDAQGDIVVSSPEGFVEAAGSAAPQAYAAILGVSSENAQRLAADGYPSPVMAMVSAPSGVPYYLIVWQDALSAPFGYSAQCVTGGWRLMYGDGGTFTPERLEAPFGTSSAMRQQRVAGYLGSQLTHETIHGIQQRAFPDSAPCARPPALWLSEGVADGLAYFLTAKQLPNLYRLFDFSLGKRSYADSLDARQLDGVAAVKASYGAGSFFRYLAEAHEVRGGRGGSGRSGADILRPLTLAGPIGDSDDAAYALIDKVLKETVGRRLFHVFPEFLTEYASYGGGRYKRTTRTRNMTTTYNIYPLAWHEDIFDKCVLVELSPQSLSAQRELDLDPVAGECVWVVWSGFTQPVSLQLSARSDGNPSDLHLGESRRTDASGSHACWDATRRAQGRLADPWPTKCILSRENHSTGGVERIGWTADFPLNGSGNAFFVLTNIALHVPHSERAHIWLSVDALQATASGTALSPPKPPTAQRRGVPLKKGLVDINQRVHALYASGDRALFDGRSIAAGDRSLGYAPGGAPADSDAASAIIRSEEYMIVLSRQVGTSLGWKAGAIIKSPDTQRPISSVGSDGEVPTVGCGYTNGVEQQVLSQTDHQLRVRLTADLFDIQRASGGQCAALKQAWVERADITVSLPNPALVDPTQAVRRERSPGQLLYEEDFVAGPMLGGIATAESIIEEGMPSPADLAPPPASAPSAPGGPPGSGGGTLPGGDALPGADAMCATLIERGLLQDARMLSAMLPVLRDGPCLCVLAEAAREGASPAVRRSLREAAQGRCD